ncbi:MAG TPA: 50S ribosomal protein L4 [Candidatus Paceibacterota bacterium]|nr:50S ribosomal protein L4 [Candidatus Paceibacterota bacterium]
MTTDIYNAKGTKAGSIDLPAALFGEPWNETLMHQVIVGMQANARTPVAHTKDRGDVSGGGKKPWRQKGTGRARHGSTRSPIWRHGGVAHGPRNDKDYSKKINRKVRAKALAMALTKKLADGEVLFVDSLGLSAPKTSDAKQLLGTLAAVKGFEALGTRRKNAAFVALSGKDLNAEKSFSNFGNIEVDEVRNLNPLDVLSHKFLIITNPAEALKSLEGRMTSTKTAAAE